MLDGPDPGHVQLLERLAGLAVQLEVGVVGLHREQVRARLDLGADQPVEADLVADDVAQADLADPEHHGLVAGGEVVRLETGRQVGDLGEEAAERDHLAERDQPALVVGGDRAALWQPQQPGVADRVLQDRADQDRTVDGGDRRVDGRRR